MLKICLYCKKPFTIPQSIRHKRHCCSFLCRDRLRLKHNTLEKRFWRRVTKTPSCWKWDRPSKGTGYGQIALHHTKMSSAHRVSWRLAFGPIPQGQWVLHKCDVRHCVNPKHLFLGSPKDNSNDALNKQRLCMGSRQWNSKLTEAKVATIRRLYRSGLRTQVELAKQFGVIQGNISHIIVGRSWKHVA